MPAGVTIALSVASSLGYGAALLFTQRKINQIRSINTAAATSARHLSTHTTEDSVGGGPWQEPNYYTNYIANMHPTARTPSPSFSSHNPVYEQQSAPGPRYPNIYTLDEDELVNQQMAMLLRKADAAPSPDASQATFHIDLPDTRDDGVGSRTWSGPSRTETGMSLLPASASEQRSGRPLSMFPGAVSQGRSRSGDGSGSGSGSGGPFARMARAVGAGDGPGRDVDRGHDRGRSDGRREGHVRAKSREERRQEIELGRLS